MASIHEEEVLGKAYDSRLMKRLLGYLRPYKWQVALALGSIVLKATADILGPYLTKVAIDRYLAPSGGASTFLARWLSPSPLSGDRKSTRLNSSHLVISYAVFCLKKKKHDQ